MIHAPVSLSETMQIVHNIKRYTSGNPSWPGGGSQLKKWLHNLFRVWQVLQDSEPSFSSYSMTWERNRNVLMWKKCKRDLSHIIITLHSVSKKPTVRKSVLGIWGTFRYLRTNRNLSVSARLSDFLVYNCSSKSLMILCSCVLLLVCLLLHLEFYFGLFFFLMSLAKDLFIFLKNRAY